MDIGNLIDLGADALGLGLGIRFIDVHEHFVFLLQLHDHFVEVIEHQAERAHDKQTGHGDPDGRKGHKSVEEDSADSLPEEVADVILLHMRNTHPFRR